MGEISKKGNDVEVNHEQKVAKEKLFITEAYEILLPVLNNSENDTTNYSPNIIPGQKGRGSSLETSAQRNQYTSLCTTGVTGQVLNISFKNKLIGKHKVENSIEQVLSASDTVIEFILTTEKFRNPYSMLLYKSQRVNWKRSNVSEGHFAVAGGLLFQILTALLISYRSENGIIVIVESYGGKKRGSHQYWKFNETSPESIAQTVQSLKEAEKDKIPFIIKNAFKIIHDKWPEYVTNVSLHWGIGCDAMGTKLSSGDNSFLVCDAVKIPEIELIRTQNTSDVFANSSVKAPKYLSAVTRGAANSDSAHSGAMELESGSDLDSDSDSESGPIRYRLVHYLLFIYLLFSFFF